MTIRSLYTYLDSLYSFSDAEEWDNSGFLVGDPNDECRGILVCLDVTPSVLKHASAHAFNVILSHHPFPFRPVSRLTEEDSVQSMLRYAVKKDLNIISMHTNLDQSLQGTGNALCRALGLEGTRESSYVWTAFLSEDCTLEKLGAHVSSCLHAPVRTFGNPSAPVRRAALIPGSGMGEIADAKTLGCDVLITGDVKHHAALDAIGDGIAVIDAGHVGTEMPVLPVLAEALQGWEEMVKSSIVVEIFSRDPYTCFTPAQEEVD